MDSLANIIIRVWELLADEEFELLLSFTEEAADVFCVKPDQMYRACLQCHFVETDDMNDGISLSVVALVKFPETVFAPLRSTGDSFQTSSSVDILEYRQRIQVSLCRHEGFDCSKTVPGDGVDTQSQGFRMNLCAFTCHYTKTDKSQTETKMQRLVSSKSSKTMVKAIPTCQSCSSEWSPSMQKSSDDTQLLDEKANFF
ncbi:unnamed protein product [Sphagnum balticum]